MRWTVVLACAIAGSGLFAAPATAQQSATAAGTVVDARSGAAVPGAVVSLGETGRQAITDTEGRFTLVRAPMGSYMLSVRRFGYRDLESTVTVSEGMPRLVLRMDPAPIALDEITVTGDARGDVSGLVINAGSGLPVPFADLTLTRGGTERVGRSATSDDLGAFEISNIEAGDYLLLAERIGFKPQYLTVSHAVPPLPTEVRLEADSALLRGLAVMNGELDVRRTRHARPVIAYDEMKLKLSSAAGMKQFFEAHSQLRSVNCDPNRPERDPPRNCFLIRGARMRPIVYIDGFRVIDAAPPPPPLPDPSYALEVLDSYGPDHLYKLEYFECPGGLIEAPAAGFSGRAPLIGYIEIHAYTYEYMEQVARDPAVPLPPCRG